jgi:transposase InsO family protein
MMLRPGSAILVDGTAGTVLEVNGRSVLLKMSDSQMMAVGLDELMFDRSRRYAFPDEPTPTPYTASRADWESVPGLDELEQVVATDFEWLERGFLGDAVRPEVAGSYPDLQSKVARMQHLAEKHGTGVRAMYYRHSRWKAGDRQGALGRRKKTSHQPHASVSPRYLEEAVLLSQDRLAAGASKISQKNFHKRLRSRLMKIEHETGEIISIPGRTVRYETIGQALRNAGTFDSSIKRQEGNSSRSSRTYGEIVASRPGQYFLVDSTRLDVHALSAFTGKWHHVELTWMMDLYSRSIVATRVSPVTTDGIDIALLFHDMFNPRRDSWIYSSAPQLPVAGVPDAVLIDRVTGEMGAGIAAGNEMPAIRPETLVTDNGKVFTSQQVRAICAANGISILRGRVLKGSDKGQIERVFRRVREDLLELICGYKGFEPGEHGRQAEMDAAFFIEELEDIVRSYVSNIYHRADHSGLSPFGVPGEKWSPLAKLHEGIARSGIRMTNRSVDASIDLLPIKWVRIQHYGVQVASCRYNGAALAPYVGVHSTYRSKKGKWPIAYNPNDRQDCFFQDPETGVWHDLRWAGSDRFAGPFSTSMMRRSLHNKREEHRQIPFSRKDEALADALVDLVRHWEQIAQLPAEDDRILLRMQGYKKPWRTATISPNFQELFSVQPAPAIPQARSPRALPAAVPTEPEGAGAVVSSDDMYYEGSA